LEMRRSMQAIRDGHGAESAFAAAKPTSGTKPNGNSSSGGGNSNNNSGGNSGNTSKITCYNCGKKGHIARKCRKPKKNKNKDNDKKDGGNSGGNNGAAKAPVGTVFIAMEEKLFVATEEQQSRPYYLDSGASSHYIPERDELINYKPFPMPISITVANSERVEAFGSGTLRAGSRYNDQDVFIELRDVYWVPNLHTRLLSIGKLADAGYEVTFTRNGCRLIGADGRVIAEITAIDRIYPLRLRAIHPEVAALTVEVELAEVSDDELAERAMKGPVVLSAIAGASMETWHRRLGHLHEAALIRLAGKEKTGMVITDKHVPFPDHSDCLSCLAGKQARLPFPEGRARASTPLDLVHMDVAGPMETAAIGGYKYYVVIVDDYTRVVWVAGMANKSDTFEKFREYQAKCENSMERKIRGVMSDNGGEFLSKESKRTLRTAELSTIPVYHTRQHRMASPNVPSGRSIMERVQCYMVQAFQNASGCMP
jgi:transposase InsO family protein